MARRGVFGSTNSRKTAGICVRQNPGAVSFGIGSRKMDPDFKVIRNTSPDRKAKAQVNLKFNDYFFITLTSEHKYKARKMADREATIEYWKESTRSYLQRCRNESPSGEYHHNITFVSPPMLKEEIIGVPFYRTLINWIKKEAAGDAKRPFEVKEHWETWKNGGLEYDEETTKAGLLSKAYTKTQLRDWDGVTEQHVIAQVDLRLYPKFKYTSKTDSELTLLAERVAKLEELVDGQEAIIKKLTEMVGRS